MYADYNDFDERYFDGSADSEMRHPAGYWYYPNELLEYDQYADEIDSFVGQRKLLVVGCGTGFAISYLVDEHGWNRVYGMDISEWAVENALDDVADRVFLGDARDPSVYDDLARDTQGPPRWDGVYTEYVLEHYTDETAQAICDIALDEASNMVVHRIWSGTGDSREDEWFNVKTVAEWIDLTGHDEDDDVYWIDHDRPEDSTFGGI